MGRPKNIAKHRGGGRVAACEAARSLKLKERKKEYREIGKNKKGPASPTVELRQLGAILRCRIAMLRNTVTSKGQTTVPKNKAISTDFRSLKGIVKSPLGRPATIEEMNEAIARGYAGLK